MCIRDSYLTAETDTLQSVVDRGSSPHLTTDIQIRAKLDCRPTSGGVCINIDPNNNELKLYNDVKALFGFGDDLEIYHSNPDNYIKSKNGTLKIQGNAITLENEDGNEQYIECVDNGSVKIYHDFIPRLETSSTGVTVSGALTAGGLTYPTVNGTNGQVLTSDGAGNVAWGAGGGGGASVTISDTPPAASAGDLWWESDSGRLKIYYQDTDSSQWVDVAPPLAPALSSNAPATASSTGSAGDIRYDSGYVYVCVATDTWKSAALTTWENK